MSKYTCAIICLVLLAIGIGPMVAAQDDAICETLRAIHTAHGGQFLTYLSAVGQQCLEPAEKPDSDEAPSCFASDTAKLAASMNIRAEASAASAKLGVAPAGTYVVMNSEQRNDYCWIEIADGWIAQTARVTPTDPVVNQTASQLVQESASTEEQPQTAEAIWTAAGSRTQDQSVSLELTRGIYALNLVESPIRFSVESIELADIISRPDNCVVQERVTFPSTLRVERNCRIFATLKPFFGYGRWDERVRWNVSITQVSDELPALLNGQEWSVTGRGFARLPVNLRFQPGIYRFGGSEGIEYAFLVREALEPNGCVRNYYSPMSSPTQFLVTKSCTVRATLNVGFGGEQIGSWSFKITRIG